MNFRSALPALALTALLAQLSAWAASAGEQWTAYSKTALSITGDVTLASDRITFGNGKSLPLAPAGDVAGFKGDDGKPVNATLYRVTAPDDPLLLNGNRLCGGRGPQPATFVVVWKRPVGVKGDPDLRTMAAFSGSERPREAGGPNLCGTYNYEPGSTQAAASPATGAGTATQCPITFHGKTFVAVTLYDGPPSMQMSLKPYQDAAAAASRTPKPVAGWDRWNLAPGPTNRHYTLVCHYNSDPHIIANNGHQESQELELLSGVRECFQNRRKDGTSEGITCK